MATPRPRDGGGLFPATRWSAIEGARSADPAERRRAHDHLAALYWKPVYKVSPEEMARRMATQGG